MVEYTVHDDDEGVRIEVRAYFHPQGALGLVYWYALLPFHGYLFRGTTRAIAKRAKRAKRLQE